MSWLQYQPDGSAILTLHIQPGARKTGLAGLHGEALKIRLAAPPVDGKANQALIAFLAERLAVPRAQISLLSGASSRSKRIQVEGASNDALLALARPEAD